MNTSDHRPSTLTGLTVNHEALIEFVGQVLVGTFKVAVVTLEAVNGVRAAAIRWVDENPEKVEAFFQGVARVLKDAESFGASARVPSTSAEPPTVPLKPRG